MKNNNRNMCGCRRQMNNEDMYCNDRQVNNEDMCNSRIQMGNNDDVCGANRPNEDMCGCFGDMDNNDDMSDCREDMNNCRAYMNDKDCMCGGLQRYGRNNDRDNSRNSNINSDMNNSRNNDRKMEKKYCPKPYVVNAYEMSKNNSFFRVEKWTGNNMQMTIMCIPRCQDIGMEMHKDTDQCIRIESGRAVVMMSECKDEMDFRRMVGAQDMIFVPAGTWHNVVNVGNTALKLTSFYSPAQHPVGTIQREK